MRNDNELIAGYLIGFALAGAGLGVVLVVVLAVGLGRWLV